MPKSNVSYPFESKMLQAIEVLGGKLFSSLNQVSVFVIQLNDQGKVLNCYNDRDHAEFNFYNDWQNDGTFQSHIFLDEIDNGEYLYIRWHNVTREKSEKLLEISFLDTDFISFKTGSKMVFPESHSVMF